MYIVVLSVRAVALAGIGNRRSCFGRLIAVQNGISPASHRGEAPVCANVDMSEFIKFRCFPACRVDILMRFLVRRDGHLFYETLLLQTNISFSAYAARNRLVMFVSFSMENGNVTFPGGKARHQNLYDRFRIID